MSVHHLSAENVDDIHIFRSSKYVQSSLDDSFCKVKGYLDEGRQVLFSGTPCQIAGLKSYLKRDYGNLFAVDMVCKGVYSVLTGKKDDDRGHTSILINTEKGYDLLRACKEYLYIDSINLQEAVKLDGRMVSQTASAHEKRNAYFHSLATTGLENAVNGYLPISLKARIIQRLKPFLYQLGILETIKKIKRR